MALLIHQILSFLSFDRLGPVNVRNIIDYSNYSDIKLKDTPIEYKCFLEECFYKKIIKRISLESYSLDYIEKKLDSTFSLLKRSSDMGIKVLSINDDSFPCNLKHLVDENGKNISPIILYIRGNPIHLQDKSVAIIGTRTPNADGIKTGTYLGQKFAENGFNVVSGLALGCDTAAHQGAISVKGITTAILAHGLDQRVYPKENQQLADNILENDGILLSEYSIGTKLNKRFLVQRDRLQSGLSLATIVVQSKINSGTMHAVNNAIANNRLLYAVDYLNKDISNDIISGNMSLISSKKAIPLQSKNLSSVLKTIEFRKC